jgi:hypothetical protein
MTGILVHQKTLKCVQIQSASHLIGIRNDKMKKIKQLIQRNKFEMAAHDMEIKFKKRHSGPTHPHSIETYANPFKRKII